MHELPTQYDPRGIEDRIYARWLEAGAFAAKPDSRERRYVIMMPLPNVTGALHMGHAMDNVMQDLLTRWHRMLGDNTLWMPGTDHAGIATQAVIEKRLLELEGKTRRDVGREGLVKRIWDWKDQYQKRIIEQQQSMGCSCDWDRQRFTMDRVCVRAVRWTFFNMFRDGLIYRGNRLVNWDCHLETAVADDEIEHQSVPGHFWHLSYPVIDPQPGEPEHVVVATTRPETMLGDTAVACHPDPAAALDVLIGATRKRLQEAGARDREELRTELERLEERRATRLPTLIRLSEMARRGRRVRLPLLDRPIPLILDEWARPELGAGCVKITPAHDPNDYDVWRRHRDLEDRIEIVNILEPDGSLNANAGPYAGLDRFVARERVVKDLAARGLLAAVEEHTVEIGHSDRSKTPIEPYLSDQWFVRMGDIDGGVVCGRATGNEFVARGLAQAAIDAVAGGWRSPTGRKLSFHPDPERYASTYLNWLGEKRDWCISRQLWWGHRLPIWAASFTEEALPPAVRALEKHLARADLCARVVRPDGSSEILRPGGPALRGGGAEILVSLRDENAERDVEADLLAAGLERETDVLDTWFSSGLWPHSTLGWPDPASAAVDEGQARLGPEDARPDCLSYYYPGSCLVTGRDIITLWVARMVVMGLYNLGDLPFTDCFVHATILDGKGERMSKSKGNGIDPVDIIDRYGADAMRYVLCEMQTGTQDIRLPVQAISPFTGSVVDLATAEHGRSIFTYVCPESGKEFDVLGSLPDVPSAKLLSERFEVGRNFCNKLLNAARFALLNLEGASFAPRRLADLFVEDRWLLSRLSRATSAVEGSLKAYAPAAAIGVVRELFWGDLCDWYLEIVKPRMRDSALAPVARQVVAVALDQVLRLLHPFVPFITEMLWEHLLASVPARGIDRPFASSELLITAPWPERRPDWEDEALEARFSFLQEVIRAIREVRSRYAVAPTVRLAAKVRAGGASGALLDEHRALIAHMAALGAVEVSPAVEKSSTDAAAVVRDVEVYLAGVVDVAKETTRLEKQRRELHGRLEGARRKLATESFLEKAPPQVVEHERRRAVELEAEVRRVEENIARLSRS
jgi:valyl-tRNA synthetase